MADIYAIDRNNEYYIFSNMTSAQVTGSGYTVVSQRPSIHHTWDGNAWRRTLQTSDVAKFNIETGEVLKVQRDVLIYLDVAEIKSADIPNGRVPLNRIVYTHDGANEVLNDNCENLKQGDVLDISEVANGVVSYKEQLNFGGGENLVITDLNREYTLQPPKQEWLGNGIFISTVYDFNIIVPTGVKLYVVNPATDTFSNLHYTNKSVKFENGITYTITIQKYNNELVYLIFTTQKSESQSIEDLTGGLIPSSDFDNAGQIVDFGFISPHHNDSYGFAYSVASDGTTYNAGYMLNSASILKRNSDKKGTQVIIMLLNNEQADALWDTPYKYELQIKTPHETGVFEITNGTINGVPVFIKPKAIDPINSSAGTFTHIAILHVESTALDNGTYNFNLTWTRNAGDNKTYAPFISVLSFAGWGHAVNYSAIYKYLKQNIMSVPVQITSDNQHVAMHDRHNYIIVGKNTKLVLPTDPPVGWQAKIKAYNTFLISYNGGLLNAIKEASADDDWFGNQFTGMQYAWHEIYRIKDTFPQDDPLDITKYLLVKIVGTIKSGSR